MKKLSVSLLIATILVVSTLGSVVLAAAGAEVNSVGESSKAGAAGDMVTYTVRLTNSGTMTDQFSLEVMNDRDWTATLPMTTTGDVAPSGTLDIELSVMITDTAEPEMMAMTVVTATSVSDTLQSANVSFETMVYDIAIVEPVDAERFIIPTDSTTTTVTLVVTTPNFTIPDDGHWHLWVNGVDTGMVTDTTTMTTLMTGTHVLSAALNDPNHNPLGPVSVANVTVLNDLQLAIVDPMDGEVFTTTNGGTASVTVVLATDLRMPDEGHWHVWVNGVDEGMITNTSTTLDLTMGVYTITAQLRDPNHVVLGPIDTIMITVTTEMTSPEPDIEITYPMDGQTFNDPSGTITIPVKVTVTNFIMPDDGYWHLWVDGMDKGMVTDTMKYVTLMTGTYTITAALYDNAQMPLNVMDSVMVTVTAMTEPIDIDIVTPMDGRMFNTSTGMITIPVEVETMNFMIPEDGYWHLWVNGMDKGMVTDTMKYVTLMTGSHTITAALYDNAQMPLGIKDSVMITVKMMTEPVNIDIVTPMDGQMFNTSTGMITIPVKVETMNFMIPEDGYWHLWVNGMDKGMVTDTMTYVTLMTGTYTITAALYDKTQMPLNVMDSVMVTVKMMTEPVDIDIVTPMDGQMFNTPTGMITIPVEVETMNFMIPEDGYWHLWVNGMDKGMVTDTMKYITLMTGTYTITAALYDKTQTPLNVMDSVTVMVKDGMPPEYDIEILTPMDGAVFTTSTKIITIPVVVTTPNFMIPRDGHWHLWIDGTDTDPVMSHNAMITLMTGTHTITAELRDPNHTPLGPKDSVTVMVNYDMMTPTHTIEIVAPMDGAVFTTTTGSYTVSVEIETDISIPSEGHWHLWVNGMEREVVMTTSTMIELMTGTHTITADLRDPNHTSLGAMDSVTIMINEADMPMAVELKPDEAVMYPFVDSEGLTVTIESEIGTVSETITLEYTEVMTPSNAIPTGWLFAGRAFNLIANRAGTALPSYEFAKPLVVTIYYNPDDLGGIDPMELGLYAWNGSEWSMDGIAITDVVTAEHKIIATVAHLTDFMVAQAATDTEIYLPLMIKSQ